MRGVSPSPAMVASYEAVLSEVLAGHTYEGVLETPARAAKAILEMTAGYDVNVADLFKTFESDGYDEMVVGRSIPFTSLCEHHLLPFMGHAGVAYIPTGRVVGLSKLGRLVDAFALRLQIQERMTVQIADTLVEHLQPLGVLVVLQAEHSCMTCRGVRKPGVTFVTSALRGLIKEDAAARAEALSLIGVGS